MTLGAELLVAAVPSLLGGLFGSKKRTTTSSVDYQKLVASAEAAGFNPLTALKHGGAGGFVTTTEPGLSSGEWLADAVGAGVERFLSHDPSEEKRKQLDIQLREAQLALLKQPFNAPALAPAGPGDSQRVRPGAPVPSSPGRVPSVTVMPPQLGPLKPGVERPIDVPYPYEEIPISVPGSDGVPRANPDYPLQPEEELYTEYRRGDVVERQADNIMKNLPNAAKTALRYNGWLFPQMWTARPALEEIRKRWPKSPARYLPKLPQT